MTSRKLVLIVTLFPVAILLQAQDFDLSLRAYPSTWYNGYFEPGMDGGGLALAWRPKFNDRTRFIVSGEFGVLKTRNECYAGLGFTRTILSGNHITLSGVAGLLNGFGLYRPKLLYTGGAEAYMRFDYRIGKRASLFAIIGARYTLCPGYREYGVWRYSSWPVGIGIEL